MVTDMMTKENVSVPMTFMEARDASMNFFNQGTLAHSLASSQEEWEKLWLEVLTKHGLDGDVDMRSLAYVAKEDVSDKPAFKVIH